MLLNGAPTIENCIPSYVSREHMASDLWINVKVLSIPELILYSKIRITFTMGILIHGEMVYQLK